MLKFVSKIMMIAATVVFFSPAMAQSLFDSNTKDATSGAQTQQQKSADNVMTADEFKNQVNSLNQETNQNLTQQLHSDVAKQEAAQNANSSSNSPASPPPPPPPQAATQSQSSTNNSNSFNAAGTPTPTTPPANVTPPSTTQVTPAQPLNYPSQPETNENMNAYAPPSAPSQQPTPPSQGQPYSGFGTGNNANTSSPSSTPQGGFNIKY